MKITIGADLGGFELKEAIKSYLLKEGYAVKDVGVQDKVIPVPYPQVGDAVAKEVAAKEAEYGFLFCGTGMGMSIVANKHKGVYCAVVESQYAAYNAREINNANMLALGGNIVGVGMGLKIVETFLSTPWKNDADEIRGARLEEFQHMIKQIEDSQFQ